MKVAVWGAGVAGLTTAYELRRRGVDVTVFDRRNEIGLGSSHFAGGMLAPHCEGYEAPPEVVRKGRSAADWWAAAIPGEVQRRGTIVVAPPRDSAELARFASRVAGRWIEEEEISSLEPELAGRFRRAYFVEDEAHLDPRRALRRLHEVLLGDGVRFELGVEARLVRQGVGPTVAGADRHVRCLGMAEPDPELRGVRGEMLMLQSSEVRLTRTIRLLHPRAPVYLVPREDGRLMVGATMIESGSEEAVSLASAVDLMQAAYAVHPALGEAKVLELGVGVRPSYPDNLPRVREDGRTLVVNGFYRHGFLLAPALAKQVADRIAEKPIEPPRMELQ